MAAAAQDTPRILLVLTNALANLVALTLRHGSYETRVAFAPNEVRELMREWSPHMAIIDIDQHGPLIEVLRGNDGEGVPMLAFTRRRDTAVKMDAFRRGVDDIVEVPFTLDEIVARPYAIMRRVHRIEVELTPKLRFGQLEVDLLAAQVRVDGKVLDLTPIQQTLLYLLAANPNEVLTRQMLIADIWGDDFGIESNVVDRHIRELRVKLGDDWRTPRVIETVPGQGYRYKAGERREDAAAAD